MTEPGSGVCSKPYWYIYCQIQPVFSTGTTSVYFVPLYVPYTVSAFKAPSSSFSKYRYVAGHGNTSTVSTFKITVPTKGKLKLDLEGEEGYSVYMKTSGFGDYEYVSSSNVRRTIGVKKGTYTFKVKSNAPVIAYRARFYKVSESKYGLKKSTAASMKKKVYKKGLIVANDRNPTITNSIIQSCRRCPSLLIPR